MSITLVEAWRMWLSGSRIPDNIDLYGIPITWWGRSGKLLSFLSGVVVILDIIGPRRLKEWGASPEAWVERLRGQLNAILPITATLVYLVHFRTHPLFGEGFWLEVLSFLTLVLATALIGTFLYLLIILSSVTIVESLTSEQPGNGLRIAALIIFIVGFHFDYLAS